jgi:fructosamine-3-kinase
VAVRAATPVAGGDLNVAERCELADGRTAFVKTRQGADPDEWRTEAAGLAWLGAATAAGGPRVPEVLEVGETFLALAWVDGHARPEPAALGRSLAHLHAAGAPGFGAPWPFRLGPVVLPNTDPGGGWPRFHTACRLLPLARRARDLGALDAAGTAAVEAVCARLDTLCGPPEPPARLHGDLWSGNVMAGPGGAPVLVDPAAHGGHREVDLAMLALFGAPGRELFDAYDEVLPRADGWEDRVGLFQLAPLLVHAVLFGGGYGRRAAEIARRYGR